RALSGVPVLTGARRRLTGQIAVERFGADVLILDDAFQHRSLLRNLDIVMMDAATPVGNGRLLPAGPLREPLASLRRAHLIVRTGSEGDILEPENHTAPDIPVFRGIRRPLGIVEGQTGRLFPADSLQKAKVCAFAGIARPEAFCRSLIALGAEVLAFKPFPDHHPYTRSDVIALKRLAEEKGADRIVTTEKDGIRLTDFPDFLADLSVLRIGMEVTPPGPFAELIFSGLA
ncbi:MAG: tetraacyldisaccharide 4'-kinase, partial [Thermodesulfobacteriota bacterium]